MRSVAVLLWGCVACGAAGRAGQAPPEPSSPAPAPERSPAARLLERLPSGAHHCVAATPSALPASYREYFAPVSQAEPFAWDEQLPVLAYATAYRGTLGGSGSRVTLLRLSGDADHARALLEQRSGLDIRWGDVAHDSCQPDDCPTAARFVAPGVLRLQRGSWPARGEPGVVDAQCRALTRRHAGAVEVSVRTGPSFMLGMDIPVYTATTVRVHPRGIELLRFDQMRDRPSARRFVAEGPSADILLSPLGVLGGRIDREQDGATVRTTIGVSWADRRLSVQDQQRRADAERYADALLRLRPVDEIDLADTAAIRRQVRYRQQLLAQAAGTGPRKLARDLQELLVRARDRHPEDPQLARALAVVSMRELDDPEAALALADAFAAHGAGEDNPWRVLGREARARMGAGQLAPVLVQAGVADAGRAREAARVISRLLRQGVPYARAETVCMRVQALARRASALTLHPLRLDAMAPEGLTAGVFLSRALTGRTPLDSIVVRAREGSTQAGRWLVVERSSTRVGLYGSAQDVHEARSLGLALGARVADGPIEIAFGAFEGEVGQALLLRGQLRDGRVTVQQVSGSAGQDDWSALARYLFRPAADFWSGKLHAPALRFSADGRTEATQLAERLGAAADAPCRATAARVRCQAPVHDPEASERALLELARTRLRDTFSRLWDQ